MFTRKTLIVWTGILLLSSLFLMGQEQPAWSPSDFIYCEDLDGDGYGARPALLCPFPLLVDCDDLNPSVHPAAAEICNGVDDDCDGFSDLIDDDGDGFLSGEPPCAGNDCDDGNPDVYPGAPELCDGLDNDCDTILPADESDLDTDQYVACGPWLGSLPGILGGDDCDDGNAAVSPGLNEGPYGDPMCSDGLDNDCDTNADLADNGCQQCQGDTDCDDGNDCTDDTCVNFACTYTNNSNPCDDGDGCTTNDVCAGGLCTGGPPPDADGDGYADSACGGMDCDDQNPAVNPGVDEGPPGDPMCTDGTDNDCDGLIDDAEDPGCVAPPPP